MPSSEGGERSGEVDVGEKQINYCRMWKHRKLITNHHEEALFYGEAMREETESDEVRNKLQRVVDVSSSRKTLKASILELIEALEKVSLIRWYFQSIERGLLTLFPYKCHRTLPPTGSRSHFRVHAYNLNENDPPFDLEKHPNSEAGRDWSGRNGLQIREKICEIRAQWRLKGDLCLEANLLCKKNNFPASFNQTTVFV